MVNRIVLRAAICCLALVAPPSMTSAAMAAPAGQTPLGTAAAGASSDAQSLGDTSTVTVTAVPQAPSADQTVTLVGTVTSADGTSAVSGSMDLLADGQAIPGCTDLAVSSSVPTGIAACQTTFVAATVTLTAEFEPAGDSPADAVVSPGVTLTVTPAATTTTLTASAPVELDGTVTYLATVNPPPGDGDAISPGGTMSFTDDGQVLQNCQYQTVIDGRASCSLRYTQLGTHQISVDYSGDGDFLPSTSPAITVRVVPIPPDGFVDSYLSWTFFYSPHSTTVRGLTATGVAPGTSFVLTCRGRGCPFTRHTTIAGVCASKRGCAQPTADNLAPVFRNRPLGVGTVITISVTHPDWLGKYYSFRIRAARQPRVVEGCLEVRGSVPGVGCTSSS